MKKQLIELSKDDNCGFSVGLEDDSNFFKWRVRAKCFPKSTSPDIRTAHAVSTRAPVELTNADTF